MQTGSPKTNGSVRTRPPTFGTFKARLGLLVAFAAFAGLGAYVFNLESVGSTNTVERSQMTAVDTEDTAVGASANESTNDESANGDDGGTEPASPTPDSEEQSTDDDGVVTAGDGIQTANVSLDDPLALTEATASATFDMNTTTGEICFDVTIEGMASPYDGHIHVGPAGVKGGIVVDLGPLSGDNVTGCIPNSPVDTKAILDDLGGHYVEFHDPDGVRTVRAQMSEIDADAVEEDSDGAVIVIDADTIRLVGDVPDQETIDKLIESFADIDLGNTTLDSSELAITPGASRPSGRIVVSDAVLFDVDSDELTGTDQPVLDTLATILAARPAWQITVVGYTDNTGSSSYNLELSLRRASAVRAALGDRGIPTESVRITGGGSTSPIADNDTEEGRAQNRRIEFEIQAG